MGREIYETSQAIILFSAQHYNNNNANTPVRDENQAKKSANFHSRKILFSQSLLILVDRKTPFKLATIPIAPSFSQIPLLLLFRISALTLLHYFLLFFLSASCIFVWIVSYESFAAIHSSKSRLSLSRVYVDCSNVSIAASSINVPVNYYSTLCTVYTLYTRTKFAASLSSLRSKTTFAIGSRDLSYR